MYFYQGTGFFVPKICTLKTETVNTLYRSARGSIAMKRISDERAKGRVILVCEIVMLGCYFPIEVWIYPFF